MMTFQRKRLNRRFSGAGRGAAAILSCALCCCHANNGVEARTVALWLFDEQAGIYPGCVLGDAATGDFPIILGPGGMVVEGKVGNALEPTEQPAVDYPAVIEFSDSEKQGAFGLFAPPDDDLAMTWANANFCGLMIRNAGKLRQEVNCGSPTSSHLNLGAGDWTVEFWYLPVGKTDEPGIVFEIGQGPRGTSDVVTQLILDRDAGSFTLVNQPSKTRLNIPSDSTALGTRDASWRHLAFVYDASDKQLRHFVDGKIQRLPETCQLECLPPGDSDYLSIGRDGLWNRPLPGRIDELRISDDPLYKSDFTPPGSFSKFGSSYAPPKLQQGSPLLFDQQAVLCQPVQLGSRKHLFIDDAIVANREHVEFKSNPPRKAEVVYEQRGVTNHLVVFEDVAISDKSGGDGLVRLYLGGPNHCLTVMTSKDGVHFEKPDLGREYLGHRNVVIEDPVGLGTIFVDPNAPMDERIKYFTGYRGRGCYLYSSPDGYRFTRNETSSLPFRGASQSIVYYDNQRQTYVGFHRSDMQRTVSGKTARTSVRTETTDLMRPWPFRRVSQAEQSRLGETMRLGRKNPFYVDNGPLTPPGFGVEYPTGFAPDDSLDPVGTDVYVPKCHKYSWAPDAYVAFPVMYFHYHGDGPETRQALGHPNVDRGSGPLESQLAVSRDGVHWKRYPRPTYVGIGRHGDFDLKKAYMGHGMIRRGDEIWQYYSGSESYHSPWTNDRRAREAVFRVVQRLDGFVSADTPYTGGQLTTKPLVFAGNRLVLNIDADATGYAQVGLLNEHGNPIEGYGVDDCVYINGDFIETEVEWIDKGIDVSELAGQTVQLVIRSRGTKLYSMQFVERAD